MNRGKKLFRILKPHLHEDETILDYCCGISQIAKYLVKKYNYIGFDYDPDVITKMNKTFKMGKFELKEFENINYKDIDALLFFRSSFTKHTTKWLMRNIETIKPKLIFVDTCLRKRQDGNDWKYNKNNGLTEEYIILNFHLIKLGYRIVDKGTIENDYYYQIWKLEQI